MHLGIKNSNQLGAMQKSVVTTIVGDFPFSFLYSLCIEKVVFFFPIQIHQMCQTNEKNYERGAK